MHVKINKKGKLYLHLPYPNWWWHMTYSRDTKAAIYLEISQINISLYFCLQLPYLNALVVLNPYWTDSYWRYWSDLGTPSVSSAPTVRFISATSASARETKSTAKRTSSGMFVVTPSCLLLVTFRIWFSKVVYFFLVKSVFKITIILIICSLSTATVKRNWYWTGNTDMGSLVASSVYQCRPSCNT